jgi:hypothetical protein
MMNGICGGILTGGMTPVTAGTSSDPMAAMAAVIAKLRAFQDAIVHRTVHGEGRNIAIQQDRPRARAVLGHCGMTLAIDSKPQRTQDFVTATGGARSDGDPAHPASAPATLERGELDEISGGIVDGTRPFPLPRPDGLPRPLPLPRPSPTIPLGPFSPSSPRPDVA